MPARKYDREAIARLFTSMGVSAVMKATGCSLSVAYKARNVAIANGWDVVDHYATGGMTKQRCVYRIFMEGLTIPQMSRLLGMGKGCIGGMVSRQRELMALAGVPESPRRKIQPRNPDGPYVERRGTWKRSVRAKREPEPVVLSEEVCSKCQLRGDHVCLVGAGDASRRNYVPFAA